jgi:hypothetical protein
VNDGSNSTSGLVSVTQGPSATYKNSDGALCVLFNNSGYQMMHHED